MRTAGLHLVAETSMCNMLPAHHACKPPPTWNLPACPLLLQVLAEPMLSAVSKEAGEAAEAGWFWRIRPLRCKVRFCNLNPLHFVAPIFCVVWRGRWFGLAHPTATLQGALQSVLAVHCGCNIGCARAWEARCMVSLLCFFLLVSSQPAAPQAHSPTLRSALRPTALVPQVDSIDTGSVAADGSGHITVLATVSESAGLWASNGKQADSYHTTYQASAAAAAAGRCFAGCCCMLHCRAALCCCMLHRRAVLHCALLCFPAFGSLVGVSCHGVNAQAGATLGRAASVLLPLRAAPFLLPSPCSTPVRCSAGGVCGDLDAARLAHCICDRARQVEPSWPIPRPFPNLPPKPARLHCGGAALAW